MMELISLLDRNERTQCLILKHLLKQTKPSPLPEMMKKIDGSKRYLQEQFQLLKKHTCSFPGVEWKETPEGIIFQKPHELNAAEIYYSYLISSMNYKLLRLLFLQGRLDATQVMLKFYISESSYYRRVRELNKVLAEFDLKIKNGLLIGKESQIRFFYFELFYEGDLLKKLEESNTDPEIKNLLTIVQEQLNTTLSRFEYQRFFLLLRITRKRLSSQYLGDTSNLEILTNYLRKDPTYLLVRNLFEHYLKRYSHTKLENELTLLYLFIQSIGVLPYMSPFFEHTYMLVEKGELFGDTHHLINQMNHLSMENLSNCLVPLDLDIEDERLKISTICRINMLILYFEGGFVYFDKEAAFELEELVPERNVNQEAIQLLKALYCTAEKEFHMNGSKEVNLYTHYALLLGYLLRKYPTYLRVGVDYEGSRLGQATLLVYLKDVLQEGGVIVEQFTASKHYDLAITNTSPIEVGENVDRLFLLTDFISLKEIDDLKHIIREKLSQKRKNKY